MIFKRVGVAKLEPKNMTTAKKRLLRVPLRRKNDVDKKKKPWESSQKKTYMIIKNAPVSEPGR